MLAVRSETTLNPPPRACQAVPSQRAAVSVQQHQGLHAVVEPLSERFPGRAVPAGDVIDKDAVGCGLEGVVKLSADRPGLAQRSSAPFPARISSRNLAIRAIRVSDFFAALRL